VSKSAESLEDKFDELLERLARVEGGVDKLLRIQKTRRVGSAKRTATIARRREEDSVYQPTELQRARLRRKLGLR
jgi:hypothetical protein